MPGYSFPSNPPAKDLMLDISRGVIPGTTAVNKFGRNVDIDSGTDEDIWDGGGTWVAPTQARTHQIASTSASDDGSPAGVGARTIRVYGLTSWDTDEVSEDITLNGTTNVATANQYVIIHRMKVLTKGATNVNVGNITATADTDATVTAQINAGEGQTQMAVYGVPSTKIAYMVNFYGSILRNVSTSGNLAVYANPEPDTELTNFLVKHTIGINSTGSTEVLHTYSPFNRYDGPCVLKLRAGVGANNCDVSAGFDLILVDV